MFGWKDIHKLDRHKSVQARFENSRNPRMKYEILWKQVSHENFGTSNHYQEELEGN